MWKTSYNPTNKSTLNKLTDNGTSLLFNGTAITGGGQTTVSTNGRPFAIFTLRGAIINCQKSNVINSNTVTYSFPPLDSDRYRRLFVWTAAGGNASIQVPDGTLNDNDALIYDASNNTLNTVNGTWGNVGVNQNQYLLLYNNLGNISGLLSKYVKMGNDNLGIPIRDVVVNSVYSNTGTEQGIFLMNNYLFKCGATSTDDHTTYANVGVYDKSAPDTVIKTFTQNFGHMNTVDYSGSRDSLLISNGSKSYTLPPVGWIIPSFSTFINGIPNNAGTSSGTLEYNTIDKITLDFSQFSAEYKGQFCWGYDGTDIIYLATNDCRTLRKVLLGKGTNNLGSGTYVDGTATPDRYNGSYQILNTWQSQTQDIHSDMFFYNGSIYMGVKGSNQIRRAIPLSNGSFDSEYIPLITPGNGNAADVEGLDYDSTYVYVFNAFTGYRLPLGDVLK